MRSEYIAKKVKQIRRRTRSHDMQEVAELLNIRLIFSNEFKNLLGMYYVRWRNRFIIVNNRLDDAWLRMVIAHEIGHDQLHRDIASRGLQEFELFSIKSRTEYEANAFAAHLLLDSNEVYDLLRQEYDVFSAAQKLNCDVNLLLIKLNEMRSLGYDIRIEDTGDSCFFKKVRT
nr:MAG TPA: IrrE protein [Caudoviricetes sp.]